MNSWIFFWSSSCDGNGVSGIVKPTATPVSCKRGSALPIIMIETDFRPITGQVYRLAYNYRTIYGDSRGSASRAGEVAWSYHSSSVYLRFNSNRNKGLCVRSFLEPFLDRSGY